MLNRRFNFRNRAHGKERSKSAENRKPAWREEFCIGDLEKLRTQRVSGENEVIALFFY
jgi:hypothetical protein